MINVADFAESFLTCSTCLSGYDSDDHSPKLLPCSHTICRTCLERILETVPASSSSFTSQFTNGSYRNSSNVSLATPLSNSLSTTATTIGNTSALFRCPICREGIAIPPRGGASSFPPAFIVNQLLDVLARQRRDVVPKCAQHPNLELLFCETCDIVFCSHCGVIPSTTITSSNTNSVENSPNRVTRRHLNSFTSQSSFTPFLNPLSTMNIACCSAQHNVVTFSVALKRCNEILLHKASLGVAQLTEAQENIAMELNRLEENTRSSIEEVNAGFEELIALVRQTQQIFLERITNESLKKRSSLTEQMTKISTERQLIQTECDELNQSVDVRRISKGISHLNEKLDQLATLSEPRVNAFLRYKRVSSFQPLRQALEEVCGSLHTSSTYPPLCHLVFHKPQRMVKLEPCGTCLQWVTHFRQEITLFTVDNCGQPRVSGGDPVEVQFQEFTINKMNGNIINSDNSISITTLNTHTPNPHSNNQNEVQISDDNNGSYQIHIKAILPGNYCLTVRVLNRMIRRLTINSTDELPTTKQSSVPQTSSQLQSGIDFSWQIPLTVQVVNSQSRPVWCSRQTADGRSLCQPFAIVANRLSPQILHVLDTGNNRLITLKSSDGHSVFQSMCHEAFTGQAATGLALNISKTPSNDATSTSMSSSMMWLTNWRLKQLILLNLDLDKIVYRIHCPEFMEPSSVHAFDTDANEKQRFLVVDNAARCIWLVTGAADVLSKSSTDSSSAIPISSAFCQNILKLPASWGIVNGFMCYTSCDFLDKEKSNKQMMDIILATTHLLQFCRVRVVMNGDNKLIDNALIKSITLSNGHFGGVASFETRYLLATRNDRAGAFIRVFESPLSYLEDENMTTTSPIKFYDVDTTHCGSFDGQRPLRRLSGLVALSSQDVATVDLAGHCVSRLQYA